MKTDLKIYTSFVSPLTLKDYVDREFLPIFIVRNIKNSNLIGSYSDTPIHMKDLAPSNELFRAKRDNLITKEEFEKKYAIEISQVNLEKVLRTLEQLVDCCGAKAVILLGYGSDYENCHRHILADILNNSGLLTNKIKEIIL